MKLKIYTKNDYAKLICVHTNGKIFDFNIFRRLGDFIRSIYYGDVLSKQAKTNKKK